MKVLSNSTIYALRALIYIAANEKNKDFVNIKKLAKNLDISFYFLTKALQPLTKEKILKSYRGPNGGIGLNKSTKEIQLIDLIIIMEGRDYFESCFLGLPGCGHSAPCPLHDYWTVVKEKLKNELKDVTLEDLGTKTIEERLRLTEFEIPGLRKAINKKK